MESAKPTGPLPENSRESELLAEDESLRIIDNISYKPDTTNPIQPASILVDTPICIVGLEAQRMWRDWFRLICSSN